MRFTFPGITRTLALSAALAVTVGCTERRTAERADSDLSHDLALAGQISTQPALKDTAISTPPVSAIPTRQAPPRQEPKTEPTTPPQTQVQNPVPVATQPAASTAAVVPVTTTVDSTATTAPAPVAKAIATGTGVALTSGMRVCTSTNKVGDKLVATVTNPVQGNGGAMIPSGSRVVLEVAQVTPGDSPDSSRIVLRPTTMYVGGLSYPVSGDISATTAMQRVEAPGTGSDKTKVVGGAVAGAILGQILGHDTKSTVIGAAAGAATGAAVAHAEKTYQTCLPEGASLVLTLNAPLIIN